MLSQFILGFGEEKEIAPKFILQCIYSAGEGAVELGHAHKAHTKAARTDPGSMRQTLPNPRHWVQSRQGSSDTMTLPNITSLMFSIYRKYFHTLKSGEKVTISDMTWA
jgi:hypothetical protein